MRRNEGLAVGQEESSWAVNVVLVVVELLELRGGSRELVVSNLERCQLPPLQIRTTTMTHLMQRRMIPSSPASIQMARDKCNQVDNRCENIPDKVECEFVGRDELDDPSEDVWGLLSDDEKNKEIPIIVEWNEEGCFPGGRFESNVENPAINLSQ